MMMGGRARALGADEHVLAAMVLFLDVVNLFLMVLQLVGLGRGSA